MKMNEESKSTRAGIYAQKSAEVMAVGDGLASKEEKSPVTRMKDMKTDILNENDENNEKEGEALNEEDNIKAHKNPNENESKPNENKENNMNFEEQNPPFEESIKKNDQVATPNESAKIEIEDPIENDSAETEIGEYNPSFKEFVEMINQEETQRIC